MMMMMIIIIIGSYQNVNFRRKLTSIIIITRVFFNAEFDLNLMLTCLAQLY